MTTTVNFEIEAEAAKIVGLLTDDAIRYATSTDRGDYRGFAALHDFCDANMLLPGAENFDCTDEECAHHNAVMAEVTRLLLAHPLAGQPDAPLRRGDEVRFSIPNDEVEQVARFTLLDDPAIVGERVDIRWFNNEWFIKPVQRVLVGDIRRAFVAFKGEAETR